MIRSIQNRIFLLIALIAVSMVVGIILSRVVERGHIQSMLDKKKTESAVLLARVVDFKSRSLRDFAYDYTYWDDMVNYTRTKDIQWADDNINVSLPTFNIDYAWVYQIDLTLLYSTNLDSIEPVERMPLHDSELQKLVSKGALWDFFVNTELGLMQISGGSIHPTSDPERKTKPKGYLFVGRMWTKKYLLEIEEFTGTSINILNPVPFSVPQDSIIRDDFEFINFYPMQNWEGRTQSVIRSNGVLGYAREFRDRSRDNLIILVIALLVVLGCVSFVLVRFINRPLRNLIYSLVADDPKPIHSLLKGKSEFGHIARLMNDFFNQKKKLVEEIDERIRIEQELVLAKEQAEESDRLKTAFLNNLSHEIRTPMNAIVGFSELLTDPRITEKERLEFTGIITGSTHRLLDMITDLISISTIDSGQVEIHVKEINLNGLLKRIHNQIDSESRLDHVAISLKLGLEDDHSLILMDEAKLTQILLNLLRNSVKFTKKGVIEFGYLIRESDIEFSVIDSGIGIPLEKFDSIFARFQQADDSLSRPFGGAGLGLPISKALVELLGGKMTLTSEVGVGTKFFFTLPFKPTR
ncbi:MAG: ATP-binding protein [Bacteroidales bacterium]